MSRSERIAGGLATVVPIGARRHASPRFDDDASLVAALRIGDRAARDVLVDRYGPYIERVLVRILGYDGELPDVLHDVFVTAFGRIGNLRHPELLKEWLRGVTVFVARECLRRRRRRRWLVFRPDDELPDVTSDLLPSDTADVLKRLYVILGRMPTDECIVFALRFMAEMEIEEVASACGVSMTTVKRRQRKAERRFAAEARKDPVLRERMERGGAVERDMNGRDELLREMASAQDELLRHGSALAHEKVRLRGVPASRASRRPRLLLPLLVSCGAVATCLVVMRSPRDLTFAVGTSGLDGEVGAAILAPEVGPLELRFSDGSLLALGASGRARVTTINERGAAILVERGHADVSVVPRKNGSWRVDVGPFAIHVKGTRFSFDWDPATERLDFLLQKGAVEITAPCLEGGRSLVAGESLRASCRSPTPAAAPSRPPLVPEEQPPPPPSRTVPAWRQLARAQDYRGALDAALARGFDHECRRSSPTDLLLLGDAARLAGDPDHAMQAYALARRKRDPSDRSAFAIGLIEFDHRRRYRRAAEWFETYVREQPRGPLIEEAEGRLMEAWQRAGEPALARQAAQEYLARHPTGQYADLARRTNRPE